MGCGEPSGLAGTPGLPNTNRVMTARDRIEFVLSIDQIESGQRNTILRALVNCLTPEQTIDLFWEALDGARDLLEACIRKICDDIGDGPTKAHRKLVASLFSQFKTLSSQKKQTVGSLLRRLHHCAPKPMRRDIERFLMVSPYLGVRRRFCTMVSQGESRFDEPLLIQLWEQYSDAECAWMLVKKGSSDYLKTHRGELLQVLTEGWEIARLYLRLIPEYPRLSTEIRAIDEITYCYVCAETRKRIPTKTAIEIFERNMGDDRIGLLIWSYGQLRMNAALDHIVACINRIEKAQRERIARKFSWSPTFEGSAMTQDERRTLMLRSGLRAGWDDPEMDVYNDLDPRQ